MKRFKQIKWTKGSGEILGFAIVLPFIILLVVTILSTIQLSNAKQEMMRTAYLASREVCVCDNETDAIDRANVVMKQIYGDKYKESRYASNNGTSGLYASRVNNPSGTVSIVIESDTVGWHKGDILTIYVIQDVKLLMPFANNRQVEKLAFMIENDMGMLFI